MTAICSAPIGVYRTSLPNIAAIQEYEAFLGGETVKYVLAYMADTPVNWTQFEQAMLATSTNGGPSTTSATAWVPLLSGRQLILSVPACCMGTTWVNETAGVNDAHWTALAHTLVAGGLGNCVLRIAREFSGGWYRWKATPTNGVSFQSGYAHVVTVMRAAGFTGKFMWNPYLLQGNFAPSAGAESVYPLSNGSTGTDTIVDIIGLDFYDGPNSTYYTPKGEVIRSASAQQSVWGTFLNPAGWDDLTGWYNLAVNHGKPLAYPEWGLRLWNDGGVYQGGGDNPILINEMGAWMKNTGAYMHAFWEDSGVGVCDPDNLHNRGIAVPQSRAAFLNWFSS